MGIKRKKKKKNSYTPIYIPGVPVYRGGEVARRPEALNGAWVRQEKIFFGVFLELKILWWR